MSGPDRHYDAEIQDLLDGRLTAPVRGEVESHLEACAECRGRLEVLRWTRQAALQTGIGHDLPEGLAGDVARLLDVEDRKRGGEDAGRRLRPTRTAWAAAAALLALAVGGSWLLLRRPAAADLPTQVASDYGRSTHLFRLYKSSGRNTASCPFPGGKNARDLRGLGYRCGYPGAGGSPRPAQGDRDRS